MLDQREQFSRSIGGRQHNRVDALTECSRQLSNLGISVEVIPCPYFSVVAENLMSPNCNPTQDRMGVMCPE